MGEWCGVHQVAVWAYCLMPNHIYLIAVSQSADGLRRAIGEAHRRFTRMVNFREGWRGHLWQGRFASFVLDEPHLQTAARYVELNPVRAGLINSPSRYPWSSAGAHVRGRDDALVKVAPLLQLATNWRHLLTRVDKAGWPQGIAPPGLPQIRTCPLSHTAPHVMSTPRDGTRSATRPVLRSVVVSYPRLLRLAEIT